jgi:hypothetical protein
MVTRIPRRTRNHGFLDQEAQELLESRYFLSVRPEVHDVLEFVESAHLPSLVVVKMVMPNKMGYSHNRPVGVRTTFHTMKGNTDLVSDMMARAPPIGRHQLISFGSLNRLESIVFPVLFGSPT